MNIKINLLPETEKTHNESRSVFLTIFLYFAIVGVLTVWILNFLYIYEIQTMKQRFDQTLLPVQSEIQVHNTRMKKRKERVQLLQDTGGPHWQAMLVCLADTKPAGITVKRILAERGTLKIDISSRQQSAVREWKEKLQNSPWFSKAYIRKWQMKGNENTAELHLLLYHEDTSKPKKDA